MSQIKVADVKPHALKFICPAQGMKAFGRLRNELWNKKYGDDLWLHGNKLMLVHAHS